MDKSELEYINFGKTDLKPSRIGFGCSHIASISTRYHSSEVISTLIEAFDRGVNFFDTSNIYGQGDSERLLGKLFRNNRHNVIFCTKAGLTTTISQTLIRRIKPFANTLFRRWKFIRKRFEKTRQNAERKCFNPTYLRYQIESSLRRLQTDYIDIFLLHSPSKDIIFNESIFEMLKELKKEGLIRFYGLSVDSTADSTAFLQMNDIECIQLEANVRLAKTLNDILPTTKRMNLSIISRRPFGGGTIFSFAPLRDFCSIYPQYNEKQVALKYLLHRNDTGVILIGMSCREHLYQNLNIANESPLNSNEFLMLENLLTLQK